MQNSKKMVKPKPEQVGEPKLSKAAWKIDLCIYGTFVLIIVLTIVTFPTGWWIFFLGLFGWFQLRAKLKPKRFASEADYKLYRKIIWQKRQDKHKKWSEKHAKQYYSKRIAASKPLQCPKCGSQQLHSDRRGFKTGRAIAGGILTGGVGAVVAGAAGKNKIMITCMHCGHSWKAGKS